MFQKLLSQLKYAPYDFKPRTYLVSDVIKFNGECQNAASAISEQAAQQMDAVWATAQARELTHCWMVTFPDMHLFTAVPNATD